MSEVLQIASLIVALAAPIVGGLWALVHSIKRDLKETRDSFNALLARLTDKVDNHETRLAVVEDRQQRAAG